MVYILVSAVVLFVALVFFLYGRNTVVFIFFSLQIM